MTEENSHSIDQEAEAMIRKTIQVTEAEYEAIEEALHFYHPPIGEDDGNLGARVSALNTIRLAPWV